MESTLSIYSDHATGYRFVLDMPEKQQLDSQKWEFARKRKSGSSEAQEEHLLLASGERQRYKNCCEESTHHVQHLEEVDIAYGREPCSFNGTVHYSYDYAQQLHYPSNP